MVEQVYDFVGRKPFEGSHGKFYVAIEYFAIFRIVADIGDVATPLARNS